MKNTQNLIIIGSCTYSVKGNCHAKVEEQDTRLAKDINCNVTVDISCQYSDIDVSDLPGVTIFLDPRLKLDHVDD